MKLFYFLVLIGSLFVSSVLLRNILNVLNIRERVREAGEAVSQLERQQRELEIKLRVATSSAFIEWEAREKLGLGKPGEVVVVLPDEEFLKSLSPALEDGEPSYAEASDGEPNWQKWLKYFFK